MRIARWLLALSCAATLTVSLPSTGVAQISALKKKAEEAKKKAEEAMKKRDQQAADSAKAKAAADSAKAKAAADSANAKAAGGAAKDPSPAAGGNAPASPTPPAKVWDNYDFVPGSRVIFFTDFSEDKVGNFARGLKYKGGPMDVVERDGVKVLRVTGRSEFMIPTGKVLPQRFTLEIDLISPPVNCCGYEVVAFEGGAQMDRTEKSAAVSWHPHATLIMGGGQTMATSTSRVPEATWPQLMGNLVHIRVLMDSAYFKMYTNERRVHNIPELQFRRDSVIRVFIGADEDKDHTVYFTSIRLAESETDVLYDALAAKGRWSTQGILFATGKAELQPESRPVLKEIASTLKEHGDLKVLIEGHTDNVGTAASNLALSDARAAAVKAALVADFGIAAERITTKGFGDTKPAVPNATATGRAQNRRVEVVKQ